MSSRSAVIVVLLIALLGVCGLSVLVSYGAVNVLRDGGLVERVRIAQQGSVVGEDRQTVAFDTGSRAVLEVDSDAGDVRIRGADVREVQATITRRAWRVTAAEAVEAARALSVTTSHQGERVRMAFDRPAAVVLQRRGIGVSPSRQETVSFDITVPLRSAVTVAVENGEVRLVGTSGAADIESSFGTVTASDVRGGVQLRSTNGALRAERIEAGTGQVRLETSFGDATADAVTAGTLSLGSTNGALTVTDAVVSGTVQAQTDFGALEVDGLRAESARLETQNGAIRADSVQVVRDLRMASTFGGVTGRALVAQRIEARSTNGALSLDGVEGELDLESDFGGITVRNARDAVLRLRTSNGGVLFAGSLDPASSHDLRSDFGDVTLELPDSSSFDVDLSTDFGRLRSDLPITVSGDREEGHWRGRIGRGGQLLTVSSANGSIELLIRPGTDR